MIKLITLTSLAVTLLSSTVLASGSGTIDAITLSSGGVAEISRKPTVSNDGIVEIEVPLNQVDDVLKSLVLKGGKGAIKSISLAGPNPLEETFRQLPFSPSSLSSMSAFLSSIPGTSVTVSSVGKTVKGKVLGVEAVVKSDDAKFHVLTVLDQDGQIQTIKLGEDTSLSVDDAEMKLKLTNATTALGRGSNDSARVIRITVGDLAATDSRLAYVVAAPIWKTAYRILTEPNGKARLQAWAVVENASGEDWKDVKLTLTSADPVTLKQRLHQIYWKDRAEVIVDTATNNVVEADTGNLANRVRVRPAASEKAAVFESDEQMADVMRAPAPAISGYGGGSATANPSGAVAAASENDTSASFTLPGTFSLTNGDSLSVPIADAQIDAEMISIYRNGSSNIHPVAAIMLKNSTGNSMPGGILTVYDSGAGYVGDAQLLNLPKDDTRIAAFATDRKVTITQEQEPTRQITDIKVVDGIVRISEKMRETTTYRISGALDADRTVIIEHPVRVGWSFSSQADDGKTVSHHRLKASVKAGEEQSVVAVDEQLRSESFGLIDVDPTALLSWSSSASDKGVAEKFSQLAKVRQQQIDKQLELQRSEEKLQDLQGEQGRIRENIAAVPENSDLKAKYLTMLEESESSISEVSKTRETSKVDIDRFTKELREQIRNF
ncbi:DUF4139 domain-containing protein [Brucella sp. HL-2]|nr:DUF4139 domain-containing protein [Brucella sp. HL-2]MCV9910434.1 DUF4139 domain-containing protein [Brucella sp. HL-2]